MSALVPLSIGSPGWRGLNKQHSGGTLPPGFATVAKNFVVDGDGRLAVRDGTRAVAAGTLAGSDVQALHLYKDRTGASVLLAASGGSLWKLDGTTWVDVTGTATTPTADDWKFQNFNGKCVAWQSGHDPIVMTTTAGSFADIVASAGTVPVGSTVLSAWGRLWVLDADTLYFSDLLDETSWTGGTAGSLLLTNVWPNGVDVPMALAEFNNFLCIFGQGQIVIYQGPDDPSSAWGSFAKTEGIAGLGCVARDTVANAGRDVIFLSGKGLRTLGRVIQEKSMPITDAAPQVRDYILQQMLDGSATDIKAVFAQFHGFYILVLKNTTLLFDLRQNLDDGSFRVTEWDGGYRAVTTDADGKLLIGNGSQVWRYQGLSDEVASDGSGGVDIDFDFEGVWNDFEQGNGAGPRTKYLKRVRLFVSGGAGTKFVFKWTTDYNTAFIKRTVSIPSGPTRALWGVAHYSVDHYYGDLRFNTIGLSASRSGMVFKVGVAGSIGGVALALDHIDLFATVGQMGI